MTEFNLEQGIPTVDEAMTELKNIINIAKSYKYKVIVIIHGYGSSGAGGKIRIKAREWLNAQVRGGKIKAAVSGEDFGMFNDDARKIKDSDAETYKYYGAGNSGITVVAV